MAAGQQQSVEAGRFQLGPRERGGELRRLGHLLIQAPGGRDRALAFGGEDHLMSGIAAHPPRHRDLRDVKVPVGQRHQNAHAGIISPVA